MGSPGFPVSASLGPLQRTMSGSINVSSIMISDSSHCSNMKLTYLTLYVHCYKIICNVYAAVESEGPFTLNIPLLPCKNTAD